MTPNPELMRAVERLNYRVTIGDVATQAGLDVNLAQQGLLALASEAGGHLQVAESGEVVYLFPKDFRVILRNRSLRLQLQEWWTKLWRILFYLIRISFGIVLLVSIALIFLAIALILIALSSSQDGENDNRRGSGGGMALPPIWFSPDFFWIVFSPDYGDRHPKRSPSRAADEPQMSFLESVFSFLFGDGNPNQDLDDRRWRAIATVIRNNQGAVVAEQLSPYLDALGQGYAQEYEDYMLPVLTRFNGRPEVSPEGGLVYQFPELQTTATRNHPKPISAY